MLLIMFSVEEGWGFDLCHCDAINTYRTHVLSAVHVIYQCFPMREGRKQGLGWTSGPTAITEMSLRHLLSAV